MCIFSSFCNYLGEKEPNENQMDDQDVENNQDTEISEQTSSGKAAASISVNPNEIKEIDQDNLADNPCLECGEVTKCKYVLLKDMPASEDENDTTTISETHYLCRIGCLNAFKIENSQYKVILKKVAIYFVVDTEQKCHACEDTKICRYRFKESNVDDTFDYLCGDECLNKLTSEHPDKFVIAKKKFFIEEVIGDDLENEQKCLQCTEELKCKYTFKQDEDSFYVCKEPCLNLLMAEQPDRYRLKRQSIRVKDLPRKSANEAVITPRESKKASSSAAPAADITKKMVARTEDESRIANLDREASFSRRCAQCYSDLLVDERNLQWETLEFCNESCLRQYQSIIGAACQTCQNAVSVASMGKYCVRFGFELRQFCRSACLDTFKRGLKVCSYCQLDISKNEEFLAPINGQFKDFCTRKCMRSYEQIFNNKKHTMKTCGVCNNLKIARVEVIIDSNEHFFCSNPCYSAFKFVNNVNPGRCYKLI